MFIATGSNISISVFNCMILEFHQINHSMPGIIIKAMIFPEITRFIHPPGVWLTSVCDITVSSLAPDNLVITNLSINTLLGCEGLRLEPVYVSITITAGCPDRENYRSSIISQVV
jgi:hypothetical protein